MIRHRSPLVVALTLGTAVAGLLGLATTTTLSRPAAPLTLAHTTDVPNYHGDFDHFAVDVKHGRLFLAGEDGAALEVFDLESGALLKSIKGYGAPHSMLLMPETNELLVVDGEKPSQILDAGTLARKRTIALPPAADSVAYDASTKHLWVVTGGKDVHMPDSTLIEIEPATGKIFNKVHFNANHVEALTVEQTGNRLYVNITDKNQVAVVDKTTGKILQWWPIKEARGNSTIDLDEATHRLFVGTRKPGKLVVLNADTGATVASFKAPETCDQLVWDAANRRVYFAGGDGHIGVFQQNAADQYTQLALVPSAPGAKTAILAPSLHRLYVAASPGETRTGGAVLRFDVMP